MFDLKPSSILGCYEIQPRVLEDLRGRFVKVFHKESFAGLGLETDFAEEYYSSSHKGVVRGMHFQIPPADHAKVVYCVQGEAFDVVLDLRVGSPTYGETASIQLSADIGNYLYISKGLAHGFCATTDIATLIYKVSSVYSPLHDSGILYSSIDVDWPTAFPVTSERDRSFKSIADFKSPFIYEQ
jgi:dTDP-4-dehydrorhamnose 3,5-epimerase